MSFPFWSWRNTWVPHASGWRGRFFRTEEVRLAILSVLEERPRHGYEVMKEFEARSGGAYKMSPGTLYPTLQQLEDEGLIRGFEEDGKRKFQVTPEGVGYLNASRDKVAGIWDRVDHWEEWRKFVGAEASIIAGPIGGVVGAAMRAVSSGDSAKRRQVEEILERAERDIKALRT